MKKRIPIVLSALMLTGCAGAGTQTNSYRQISMDEAVAMMAEETMETKENYLPGEMCLSFGGLEGLRGEPMSLVEGDPIATNLLIRAYDKPITISDLSRAIGIPAAYIEPIVKKLVDG